MDVKRLYITSCVLVTIIAGCSTNIETEIIGAELDRFDREAYQFATSNEYYLPDTGSQVVRMDFRSDRNLIALMKFRDLNFTADLFICGVREPDYAVGDPGRKIGSEDSDVWSIFIEPRSSELAKRNYFPGLFESNDETYCLAIYGGSMTGMSASATEMVLSDRHLDLLQALIDDD